MNDDRYKNLINNLNFNIPTLNFQKYYESTDSFKALQAALKSFQQQMLPTKLMMEKFSDSYKAMLEPIAQITGNYRNMIQPLFESEEFKQAIASLSSIPLSNVEHLDVSIEKMLTEENTSEIFEQLSQNVEPVDIAKNMETKTSFDWKYWLEMIFVILGLIWAMYSHYDSKENVTNIYNVEYHIENMNISIQNFEQIDEHSTDNVNPETNS